MPFLLDESGEFPNALVTDEHGILAIGGDYSPKRLLKAYEKGIFPWPHRGLPPLWFCPNPRFILVPNQIKISRSLQKALKTTSLTIKADTNFLAVIKQCQRVHDQRSLDTWITDELIEGYYTLHQQGYAHSIEAYEDEELVGGLYGINLGSIFFGESMFYTVPNASKICFVTLVAHLINWQISLIDCQAHTHHLARFGAFSIDRNTFLQKLKSSLQNPSKMGPWLLHLSPLEALEQIIRG